MIRRLFGGVCDYENRLAALVFQALAGRAAGCPCCSFWRGVLTGGTLGAAVVAALRW